MDSQTKYMKLFMRKKTTKNILSLYSIIRDFFTIWRLFKDMVFLILNKQNTKVYSM